MNYSFDYRVKDKPTGGVLEFKQGLSMESFFQIVDGQSKILDRTQYSFEAIVRCNKKGEGKEICNRRFFPLKGSSKTTEALRCIHRGQESEENCLDRFRESLR